MGTLVARRLASIPTAPTRHISELAAGLENVISLAIGEPDFYAPEPVIQAGIESLRQRQTHYAPDPGLLELRQAVGRHLARLYQVRYDPEQELLITVGVSEALNLALIALLDPGDEVIVPEPCYPAYLAQVMLSGGVPVPVPTGVETGFQVTAAAIEQACTPRTKAIILGNPANPTGAVLSRANLEQVGQLAARRNLVVIADEIYDRLVYGVPHVCFAALPEMQARTVLLGGFSKAYAMTGFRIGYAAGPAEIIAAMRKVHQYTIITVATTVQYAALKALEAGESFVEQMVSEYDRRRRLVVAALNAMGLDCFEPQGAFFAFPSIARSGMSDVEFADRLLSEERVAVVPGSGFGRSGQGFIRLSYAAAYPKVEEALNRIEQFVLRHA